MYTSKIETNHTFSIDNLDNVDVQGRGKALSLLRDVDDRLSRVDNNLFSYDQAVSIQNAVLDLQNTCKSRWPRLYKWQAFWNPFSNAYKIERLVSSILAKTGKIISEDQKFIDLNTSNAHLFFAFKGKFENIKQDSGNDKIGYIYYIKNSNYFCLSLFNVMNGEDALTLPIEMDQRRKCIRLLTKKEIMGDVKMSFDLPLNQEVAKKIVGFVPEVITHQRAIQEIQKL